MAKISKDVEKSLKIQRYTLLRYLNAILFFIYLHWLIGLVVSSKFIGAIIPFILIILILVTVKNQFASFTDKEVNIKISKDIYIINLVGLIIVSFVSIYNYKIFFPYLGGKLYVYIILAIIIIVSIILYIRSNKIYKNEDKVYEKYIKILNSDDSKVKQISKIRK
ncbi:hypothetical protein NH288_03560 [Anaerococcus sp. NML200537]|uniref:hypothetical protein n=1 Tax=Anaerococcus sp. NML200537 TaxID=2954485 RepID=UPI0022373533|nr:hypothetical protein [Anaerococcus sp. NML200537]MCW6701154.1 hypothetical protein [Anaerococcus sp. NML200537]